MRGLPLVHDSCTKESLVREFCARCTEDETEELIDIDRQATRNAWRLFNLRESPFFQEPLQAGTRYPMSLFVGRAADTDCLLNKITRSPGSSRQTVRGAVGVGKSTLAQHVKAEVAQDGVLSTPVPVSVSSALTIDQLCALVLRSVLDPLVGTTPQKPAVQRRLG